VPLEVAEARARRAGAGDRPCGPRRRSRRASPNGGWGGGTILDPQSGDTDRCKVKAAAPDTLDVRGFVGISLFGRTQTWKRTTP
jgi:uncharacterized protein (DUF2147 family)